MSGCQIMCWNVWSMMDDEKRGNILQILDDWNIQIACITETWFDSKDGKFSSNIKEAGYELKHGYRENQRGGGVAILYKSTLNVKPGEASTSQFMSFEYSFVTVTIDKSKVVLVCIYRKQEVSCGTFCDELENLLETIFYKGDSIVVVGDMNIWANAKGDHDAEKMLTLMNNYGLTQLVDKPTHRGGNTLDHVYTNPYQNKLKLQVVEDTLGITTDHYPLVIEFPTIKHQQKKQTISFRRTRYQYRFADSRFQ